MKTFIQTQQFGIRQILSLGGKIFSSNFRKILAIILCVHLPENIRTILPVDAPIENVGLEPNVVALAFRSIWLIQLLLHTIGTIAIAHVVEQFIHERNTTCKQALQHGVSRFPSLLGTSVLYVIILTGLTLLLIVPGIIWCVYYTFWVYVVALRSTGGKKALDYSKMLVHGQWRRVANMGLNLVILWGLAYLGLFLCLSPFLALPFMLVPITNPAFVIVLKLTVFATNLSTDMFEALLCVTTVVWFLNVDYMKNPSSRPHVAIPETASA